MHKTLILFFTVFSIILTGNLVNAQTKVVVVTMGGDEAEEPTEKTIFLTDTPFNGNLGGIAGADDKCQTEADNAEPTLTGIYKAWISRTGTPDITTRPSFQKHDLPYKNVDGSLIATSFDDFLDGVFPGVIKRKDGSNPIVLAWTGTSSNGGTTTPNCSNWSNNAAEDFGASGWNDGGTMPAFDWSSHSISSCGNTRALYCFEQ